MHRSSDGAHQLSGGAIELHSQGLPVADQKQQWPVPGFPVGRGPAGVGLGGVCGFFGFGEAAAGLGEVGAAFLGEGCGAGAASAFGKKLGLFGCRGAASAASGFGGASALSGDGRLGAGAFAFFGVSAFF